MKKKGQHPVQNFSVWAPFLTQYSEWQTVHFLPVPAALPSGLLPQHIARIFRPLLACLLSLLLELVVRPEVELLVTHRYLSQSTHE